MHMLNSVHSLDFSCDCTRVMALDANSTIWNLESWGRPYRLVSPLLNCSSPEKTPIQIACGSLCSAVLTRSGDVYAWPAHTVQYDKAMAELDKDESTRVIVPDGGTVIPCHTWEINMDPVKLPIPPDLPDLPMTGLPEEERRKETKFIEVATCSGSLVGLTNKGHVLKMGRLDEEGTALVWDYVSEITRVIWHPFLNCDTQLPNYSEIDKVKKHPAFHTTTSSNGKKRPPQMKLSSDTMLITHVSYIALMNSQSRV